MESRVGAPLAGGTRGADRPTSRAILLQHASGAGHGGDHRAGIRHRAARRSGGRAPIIGQKFATGLLAAAEAGSEPAVKLAVSEAQTAGLLAHTPERKQG